MALAQDLSVSNHVLPKEWHNSLIIPKVNNYRPISLFCWPVHNMMHALATWSYNVHIAMHHIVSLHNASNKIEFYSWADCGPVGHPVLVCLIWVTLSNHEWRSADWGSERVPLPLYGRSPIRHTRTWGPGRTPKVEALQEMNVLLCLPSCYYIISYIYIMNVLAAYL